MQPKQITPSEFLEYTARELFENKNLESLIDSFTEDARWIGAADPEDRLICGKEQIKEVMTRIIFSLKGSFKVKFSILDEMKMASGEEVVLARIFVENAETGLKLLNMRSEALIVSVDGVLKIRSMHSSVHHNFEKHVKERLEVKKSQLELNSVVNAIPGGIAVYKLVFPDQVQMLYYSDGVAALTGHTREEFDEMLRHDVYAAVYKEDFERFRAALIQGISSAERVDITYRRVHKDGSLVWTAVSAQSVGVENGEYTGHAVFTGTPEQFNLQRTILDETVTSIYVVDAQSFEIYYANKIMMELLHVYGRDYNGQTCYKFFFDRDKPCASCGICTGKKLDGAERPLPQFDKICRVWEKDTYWMQRPAMIRYAIDITEQKRAQEQLLNEQDRYRLIVENTGAVIFDWDLVKNTFYFSNNIVKYDASKVGVELFINKTASPEAVHPEDLASLNAFAEETKLGKPFSEATLRVKMRDGSYRWTVVSSYNILDSHGNRIRMIGTIRDVDDEQKIIYENKLNLHRANTVIEDSEVQYWEYDITTHRALIGETSQTLVGLPEVLEDYPHSLIKLGIIPDEHINDYISLHQKIEEGAEYSELRIPMRQQDDKLHWYRVRYHTLFNEDGKPIRAIGTAIDISEQVEAHRQYDELVALQEMIGQKSHDYVVINLSRDSIVSMRLNNQEELRYAGQSFRAFIKNSSMRIIGEKNRKKFTETFKTSKLLNEYSSGIREKRLCIGFVEEGGKELWLDIHMSITKNPVSSEIFAFAFGTDITDQHMAQEVLDAVTSFDFDVVAILNINAGSVTLYNYQETRLKQYKHGVPIPFDESNRNFVDACVLPEDRERYLKNNDIENIRRELEDKDKYEFTFRTLEDNGEIRIKKTRYAYYDRQNGIVLLTRIDVSDVVESQEKLNRELNSALRSAQQANVAKTTFLSAMSHDIRTPMNAIIGMTELAIVDRNNQEQVDESLATIKEASGHLLYLINDILEMSRIESGKMVLSQDKFSQKELFERILQMAQPLVKKKKIDLKVCPELKNDICYGDNVRLYRVLENLVSNAVKFTPEKGCVSLRCQDRPIGSGDMVMFNYTITDTGVGMEADQLENIFEPFYRASSAVKSGVEGSGLGLSIVKSIVELMGGSISVKSQIGSGSVFSVDVPFRIPQDEEAMLPSPQKGPERPSFKGVRVLLAEDHPINAIVATRLIERLGACVVHAENGKIAYELFAGSDENEFDAIIMDLQMPVMDGFEATRAIRSCKHPRAGCVPIIAVTANAYAEDVRKSLLAGMNAHIPKPISMDMLAQVLASALIGKKDEKTIK